MITIWSLYNSSSVRHHCWFLVIPHFNRWPSPGLWSLFLAGDACGEDATRVVRGARWEIGGRSVGDRWEIGGKDDAMWKTIGKWWFNGILWWFTRFNSGFYHSKWWFSIVMLVYQRVIYTISNGKQMETAQIQGVRHNCGKPSGKIEM